jgi:hypothetical protein
MFGARGRDKVIAQRPLLGGQGLQGLDQHVICHAHGFLPLAAGGLTAGAALKLAAFDERIDELHNLSAFFRR